MGNYDKFSKKETRRVINLYKKGLSAIKISNLLKRSVSTITRNLKENNIKIEKRRDDRRKIFFDLEFFNKIDTEEKAYFLGFLFADGYVSKRLCHVFLKLQKRDKEILLKFKNILNYKQKLSLIKTKDNQQDQYLLLLCSKKMCLDLVKLGCFNCKSLTLKFPTKEQVPEHLLRHFVRGYFDGDGCIHLNKRSLVATIYSSLYFCKELRRKFSKIIGKPCGSLSRRNKIYILTFGGNTLSSQFFSWIYNNSKIYLKRKYKRWKIFNKYNNIKNKRSTRKAFNWTKCGQKFKKIYKNL